jgi:hypothetical protein
VKVEESKAYRLTMIELVKDIMNVREEKPSTFFVPSLEVKCSSEQIPYVEQPIVKGSLAWSSSVFNTSCQCSNPAKLMQKTMSTTGL